MQALTIIFCLCVCMCVPAIVVASYNIKFMCHIQISESFMDIVLHVSIHLSIFLSIYVLLETIVSFGKVNFVWIVSFGSFQFFIDELHSVFDADEYFPFLNYFSLFYCRRCFRGIFVVVYSGFNRNLLQWT